MWLQHSVSVRRHGGGGAREHRGNPRLVHPLRRGVHHQDRSSLWIRVSTRRLETFIISQDGEFRVTLSDFVNKFWTTSSTTWLECTLISRGARAQEQRSWEKRTQAWGGGLFSWFVSWLVYGLFFENNCLSLHKSASSKAKLWILLCSSKKTLLLRKHLNVFVLNWGTTWPLWYFLIVWNTNIRNLSPCTLGQKQFFLVWLVHAGWGVVHLFITIQTCLPSGLIR